MGNHPNKHILDKKKKKKKKKIKEKAIGKAYLKEAAARHCSIAGSVALDCRPLPQAVAPPLDHVKPLRVPDVSF